MNATTKTPKKHRSELLGFVHRPQLLRIDYAVSLPAVSPLLAALQAEFQGYDFGTDPYVVSLLAQQQQGNDITMELQKFISKRSTYCYEQLKMLHNKAKTMAEELGTSVSEWYVSLCSNVYCFTMKMARFLLGPIRKLINLRPYFRYVGQCLANFERMMRGSDQQLLNWTNQDRQHLSTILQRLPTQLVPQAPFTSPQDLSDKVEALVDVLVVEAGPECTGIVFVEQRVWVAALAEILSIHTRIKDKFGVGTFVGTSASSKRKANVANFAEPKNQQDTLAKFRAGETNLILATSVLEEGIDVSSCHLVICFERPKNLKSFVQRRGRARKQQSKYYIFLPKVDNIRGPESWESMEKEMRKAYLDDQRKVKQAEERENQGEPGERYYRVKSTG